MVYIAYATQSRIYNRLPLLPGRTKNTYCEKLEKHDRNKKLPDFFAFQYFPKIIYFCIFQQGFCWSSALGLEWDMSKAVWFKFRSNSCRFVHGFICSQVVSFVHTIHTPTFFISRRLRGGTSQEMKTPNTIFLKTVSSLYKTMYPLIKGI